MDPSPQFLVPETNCQHQLDLEVALLSIRPGPTFGRKKPGGKFFSKKNDRSTFFSHERIHGAIAIVYLPIFAYPLVDMVFDMVSG